MIYRLVLFKIRDVSRKISVTFTEYAYKKNLAVFYPKPNDLEKHIQSKSRWK
jgi:hypothetical protein